MNKYVFLFKEGNKEMKALLGGKGANLAEMVRLGLPVPSGFTITTEACIKFQNDCETLSQEIIQQIMTALATLEQESGKKFGCSQNPLLVSVRSGAAISMPGMMDTILNLGLNEVTVKALANQTENERFAYDSYRRFIQMFSDVVQGIPKYKFELVLDRVKHEKQYQSDLDLTTDDLKSIVCEYQQIYKQELQKEFPNDPYEQLLLSIQAVFRSWNNPRAIVYRNLHGISHQLGTAVNVQMMVFGNMGDTSGTGVAFTRNPSNGTKELYGEFLANAQGEDVVAGIRTPQPIAALQEKLPKVYEEFAQIATFLERHHKDMQDIEFTVEKGKLYLLQTRNGKRTAQANLKIQVDLVLEGLISKEEAIMRIDTKQFSQLLHPSFDPEVLKRATCIAQGLPASPGASSGKIYFSPDAVILAKKKGEKVILVRKETSPDDILGMINSEGILTTRGGMTSHAAVVARGMGKCCIAGCSTILVDEEAGFLQVGDLRLYQGETISLDGDTGKVYLGEIAQVEMALSEEYNLLMSWIDEIKRLAVRANADTKQDCLVARRFGAEGIGLCRTEHMFFDEGRILNVQRMILADHVNERKKALEALLPIQREDFIKIFTVMEGLPCTIRLLDPPLHEFLPKNHQEIERLARYIQLPKDEIERRIEALKEVNPMLGHRGARLAITYPEIYEMQVRAICEAAQRVQEQGLTVKPEIMIPLIMDRSELQYVRKRVESICENFSGIEVKIGTMIEVPRATLIADEIAEAADFFSFGTNDLTQMTFGFSRDDTGKFIQSYHEQGILETDPFMVLDTKGVGKLMKIAFQLGRSTNPHLKVGLCGEHGGEAKSIQFCDEIGLDYVSTSPYRVPVARLAAAQSSIMLRGMRNE